MTKINFLEGSLRNLDPKDEGSSSKTVPLAPGSMSKNGRFFKFLPKNIFLGIPMKKMMKINFLEAPISYLNPKDEGSSSKTVPMAPR